MSDIPNNPESTSLSRRDVIKVASAFGSAAVFNAACSRLGSLTETPQVTTPTPTEKIIESEIEKPINISIGGGVSKVKLIIHP